MRRRWGRRCTWRRPPYGHVLPHVGPEESPGPPAGLRRLGHHPEGLVVDLEVGQGEHVGLGLH